MKKIILISLMLMLVSVPVMANDSQRKVSSGEISAITTYPYSEAITTVPSILYDVEIVATVAGGYAVVFDTDSTDNISTATKLVELREATQYNSKHVNLGEFGIKAYTGITVFTENAEAILYYH